MRILDREKLRSDLTRIAWEKLDKGELSDSYIIVDIHRGYEEELMEIAEQFGVDIYKEHVLEVSDDFFDK